MIMKNFTLPLLLTSLFMGVAAGQDKKIDLEARERSVEVLESRIEDQNRRVSALGKEIMALHQGLGAKFKRLVDRLSAITDSPRSGYRVGKTKQEVIADLKTTAESFITKRDSLERSLNMDDSPARGVVAVQEEIDHFNAEADRQLAQMVELSKSFARDKTVEKYNEVGGSGSDYGGYGWYEDTIEISDEWRQNRRDRSMNNQQREVVMGVLDRAIERCTANIRRAEVLLDSPDLSELERQILTAERDSHKSMLERRKRDKDQMLDYEQPEIDEVGRDFARELEKAVDEALFDVQQDLRMIMRKHVELRREQVKVHAMSENLQARRQWLKEYHNRTDNRTEE